MNRILIKWTPELYDWLSSRYDRLADLFFGIGETGRQRVVQGMQPGRMLDIGCGTGTLLVKAHTAGIQTFGVDTSSGMLSQAQVKVPQALLVRASFYALPFAEEQFDYVVETNAVSGEDIDFEVVIKEMLRVCKTGGEVRLGDYLKASPSTAWTKLVERVGLLIGDMPHNYPASFRRLGFEAEVERLGMWGMYAFVKVKKDGAFPQAN